MSIAPVDSPTPIICTTIGGKTFVSASGSAMFLPSEIFARTYMMPSSMILLPAVFATMSSASRIGTPEESIVPSVRVKRATATLRTSGPKTGILSTNACHFSRPRGLLVNALNAMTSAIGTATNQYQ